MRVDIVFFAFAYFLGKSLGTDFVSCVILFHEEYERNGFFNDDFFDKKDYRKEGFELIGQWEKDI